MYKKRDLVIILILILLLAAAVSYWIYNRQSFTVEDTNALIDNSNRVIFVSLPEGSPSRQKISFNFPFQNNEVYIKKLASGGQTFKDPVEKKLVKGEVYDFGEFISHCKLILKSKQSSIEYDLWVTTGELPIVTIEAEEDIPDEPKVDCTMKILSQNKSYNTADIASEIELIDVSEDIPKNSYSLNIKEDPITGDIPAILDFEASKRFRISASYTDRSFLREKLAYDIFKTFSDDNIAPESRYVEIYLNGSYQGLYILSRRVDRNMFSIPNFSQDDTTHGIIYEAINWRADFSRGIEGFSQIEPDHENDMAYYAPLEELIKFITETENDEFFNKADETFDMNSILDNHILFLLSGSDSELAPNQYIYRGSEEGARFKFCPGSFYSSGFGRKEDSTMTGPDDIYYGSRLYNRFYENEAYRKKLKERWNSLRENTITSDNILSLIEKNSYLLAEAQNRNFKIWSINADFYNESLSFDQEIDYINKFIRERIDWLDDYINYPPLIMIGDNYAAINEESGTIFCALPSGSDTLQKIRWYFHPDTDVSIEPVSIGKYNTYRNKYQEYQNIFDKGVRTDDIFIFVDYPKINDDGTSSGILSEKIILEGWAVDPRCTQGTGVDRVFVFDGPLKSKNTFVGEAEYGISRPDVADHYNNPDYENSGFMLQINTFYLENGPHNLYIYTYSSSGGYSLKKRPIEIRNKNNVVNKINDRSTQELKNGQIFDFEDYIFHGLLSIDDGGEKKEYDLWVTADTLPIVYIDTNNINMNTLERINANMEIMLCDQDEKNFINRNKFEYTGNILVRIRGKSTLSYPKKQYAIELRNEEGSSENIVSLFGMPEESDWILHAPYGDKTLIRNVLAFELSNQMGSYASRTEFVEVFLSEKEDLIIEGGYNGLYVFMENIKRDKNRVNVEKLESEDENITGGYILEMEVYQRFRPNEYYFRTNRGLEIIRIYPREENATEAQEEWIIDYINEFESALYGDNFKDAEEGYRKYIDIDSFIDYIILNELLKNSDIFNASTFMYKDKDGKLRLGPVWDFNASSGNSSIYEDDPYNKPTGFVFLNKRWTERLFLDYDFRIKYVNRWKELRKDILSDDNIIFVIENSVSKLSGSPERNFDRWEILGKQVWPNPEPYAETYEEEIENFKNWFLDRTSWIDNNINTLLY
jgi:spore coat protein CotH